MNVIDCPWELANLDCRVAEISVSADEVIDKNLILELEQKYDYLVLKNQSGVMINNMIAAELGFVLAETQLSLQKEYRAFSFEKDSMESRLIKQMSVEKIVKEEDFNELMSLMTEDMFSTDRIFLDPQFGPSYSTRRYKNWTRTEWERGSLLYKHFFNGKYVGYSLLKLKGNELSALLAGNFIQFQNTGMGFWIPLIPKIIGDVPFKLYTTKISSNNLAVWRLYNWQNYKVDRFEYVFVKHIKH